MINRRQFLQSCAIVPVAASFGSTLATAGSGETLKAAASQAGLLYGSPLFPQDLNKPRLLDLYAEQTSLVVSTMYMRRLQAQRGQFDFSAPDSVRDFARSKGLQLRGHPLVYGKATPDWVQNEVSRDQAQKVLEQHVHTLVARYAGQMHS